MTPLTGLPNRRFLDRHLAPLLERTSGDVAAGGRPGEAEGDVLTCVAMVDIDHFKRINDTLSHAIGDDVLAVVAAHVASVIRLDAGTSAHGDGPTSWPSVSAGKSSCSCSRATTGTTTWSGWRGSVQPSPGTTGRRGPGVCR